MGLRLQQVDARVLIKTRNHRFLFLLTESPHKNTKSQISVKALWGSAYNKLTREWRRHKKRDSITISLFFAMKFHVYILQSTINGSFYIGQTGNIERRLNDHNKGFSKATARYSL
jgi:hypothetical protein